MAIDATQLTDYTWAQLATAAKQAMMNRAIAGASSRIADRGMERASMEELQSLYNFATQMQNDESTDSSGGLALVQFGERA